MRFRIQVNDKNHKSSTTLILIATPHIRQFLFITNSQVFFITLIPQNTLSHQFRIKIYQTVTLQCQTNVRHVKKFYYIYVTFFRTCSNIERKYQHSIALPKINQQMNLIDTRSIQRSENQRVLIRNRNKQLSTTSFPPPTRQFSGDFPQFPAKTHLFNRNRQIALNNNGQL